MIFASTLPPLASTTPHKWTGREGGEQRGRRKTNENQGQTCGSK